MRYFYALLICLFVSQAHSTEIPTFSAEEILAANTVRVSPVIIDNMPVYAGDDHYRSLETKRINAMKVCQYLGYSRVIRYEDDPLRSNGAEDSEWTTKFKEYKFVAFLNRTIDSDQGMTVGWRTINVKRDYQDTAFTEVICIKD